MTRKPEHNTSEGYDETLNPAPVREATAQEKKEAAAKAKIAAKAEKIAAAETTKQAKAKSAAAKKAEKAEATQARKEAAAENRAAKETGKVMGALADRIKSGTYVKSITGQLRSDDALAQALDGVTPTGIVVLGMHVLGDEENKYTHLNQGQQSMNYRNRMRGALTRKVEPIELATIVAAIAELDLDSTAAILEQRDAKAARIEQRKAENESKIAKAKKAATFETA